MAPRPIPEGHHTATPYLIYLDVYVYGGKEWKAVSAQITRPSRVK